jgi:O-antigen/teichoic acid export membrane protein
VEAGKLSEVYAKRLVRGSALIFFFTVASALLAFFLRMYLARELSVKDYGLFYAIFAFFSFFALFRDMGLNSALVKYIPEFKIKGDYKSIRSSIFFAFLFQSIFALTVSTILFLFSDWFAASYFKTSEAALPFKIMSLWFFLMTFYWLFAACLHGFQRFSVLAPREIVWISTIFSLSFLLVGIWGQGVEGVTVAYVGGTVVAILYLWVFLRREIGRNHAQLSRGLAKRLLLFSLPVFLGGIGGTLLSYTDTLMLTHFRALRDVALYQVAQPLAGLLGYFSGAMVTVFYPTVSELWTRGERELLRDGINFLTKFAMAIVLPASLVLITFPDTAIRLVFGEGYLEGARALQLLALTGVISTLWGILTSVMAGIGKPTVNSKVMGVMACLNFITNWLLIPPFGATGAAAATLASALLGFFLLLHYTRRTIGPSARLRPLLKIATGGLLTLVLIFWLKSVLELSPWTEALTILIPSLLLYGIWLLMSGALTKGELELLSRAVPVPRPILRVAEKLLRG